MEKKKSTFVQLSELDSDKWQDVGVVSQKRSINELKENIIYNRNLIFVTSRQSVI